MANLDQYKGLLLGIATGDALGIQARGKTREELQTHPVLHFQSNRNSPEDTGTWSAGSALSFCLAQSILEDASLETIRENFLLWKHENYWTALGRKIFADEALESSIDLAGKERTESANTDLTDTPSAAGTIMRIAPLVFFLVDKPIHKRFEIVKQVISLTHHSDDAVFICFYYLEYLGDLLQHKEKLRVYRDLQERLPLFFASNFFAAQRTQCLSTFLETDITLLQQAGLLTSGDMMGTLLAALWCFLQSASFKEATLRAANLGGQSNVTASITGALAGITYGAYGIPSYWLNHLVRKDAIADLAKNIYEKQKGGRAS